MLEKIGKNIIMLEKYYYVGKNIILLCWNVCAII